MTARALAALGALAAMGFASMLAACDAPSTDRLTKSELVRRANEGCATANHRIARLEAPDPLDATATAAHLGRVIRVQRRALRKLRRLVAPAADEREYRR